MELISRKEVLDYLKSEIVFWKHEDEKVHKVVDIIEFEIEELPIIESRPKGKWVDSEGKERTKSKYCGHCSICGGWSEYLTDFCGNCGADMREED